MCIYDGAKKNFTDDGYAEHLNIVFAAVTHSHFFVIVTVAFKIYDIDRDGYISNGELFQVLKMMVGNNLKDGQLQQIVDKTIIYSDKDGDGRISYDEFCAVSNSCSQTSCCNISCHILHIVLT